MSPLIKVTENTLYINTITKNCKANIAANGTAHAELTRL